LSDTDVLPPPNAVERRLLDRIQAPSRVRLACQVRPERDLNVKVLLSAGNGGTMQDLDDDALKIGNQRDVAVLVTDIRGFSTLARTQLPQDLVVLLNRVVDDMKQAVSARGGFTAVVVTDGLMAVFGTSASLTNASKAAILAAGDILKATEATNRDIGGSLPQPLRVGVGIHYGSAVLARLGDEQHGHVLNVIGETVLVANRLEEATKEFGADCIISDTAMAQAGIAATGGAALQLQYKSGESPIAARAFADAAAVAALFK
jgi:adenylate cyclase